MARIGPQRHRKKNGAAVYLEFWIWYVLRHLEEKTTTLHETWLVLVTAIPFS